MRTASPVSSTTGCTLTKLLVYPVAFLVGIPVAFVWAGYTVAVNRGWPFRAALADLGIVGIGIAGVLELWQFTGQSGWVVLVYAAGNATGTYMATWLFRRRR